MPSSAPTTENSIGSIIAVETPQISLRKLQAAIPDFDWEKGHSGVLLSSDVTDRLTELWHSDQGFVNLFADPYVN